MEKVSALRESIEKVKRDIEASQQKGDLERTAELQYGELPSLQKQLETEEASLKDKHMGLVHESVTEDEIAKIISRWTGIPVAKLT